MKYLFLDTNIYLHYIDVEQIDWNALFEDKKISIVVPSIVIREIDRHKDQSRGKIQKRAKTISTKFAKVFLENKSSKYPFVHCCDPNSDCFGNGFNINVNDDWFILSAIQSEFAKEDIVIISSDTNLLLKAKENELNFIMMPDKYKLKEELSDEEREIKALKDDLEKYKNRQPKPLITFGGEKTEIVFSKPQKGNIENAISAYMEKIRKENPYMNNMESDLYKAIGLSLHLYNKEQIDKYNNELDEYFEKEEKYRRFLLQKEILNRRFQKIFFYLTNTGTAQTGDMNIFIEFPSDIKLYNEKSKASVNDEKPIKPIFSNSLIGLNQNIFRAMNSTPLGYIQKPQTSYWDVDKELEEHEFHLQYSGLNHIMTLPLNIKDSIYIDTENCKNFTIRWRIIDSKLIEPREGILNVFIE